MRICYSAGAGAYCPSSGLQGPGVLLGTVIRAVPLTACGVVTARLAEIPHLSFCPCSWQCGVAALPPKRWGQLPQPMVRDWSGLVLATRHSGADDEPAQAWLVPTLPWGPYPEACGEAWAGLLDSMSSLTPAITSDNSWAGMSVRPLESSRPQLTSADALAYQPRSHKPDAADSHTQEQEGMFIVLSHLCYCDLLHSISQLIYHSSYTLPLRKIPLSLSVHFPWPTS